MEDFPADYARGHFVLVGPTGTGKTHYAKFLVRGLRRARPGLRVHVFVAEISAEDWRQPEPDGAPLVAPADLRTAWTADGVEAMYLDLRAARCGLVIFDDFKSQLDYHNDRAFKDMFRTFRHVGAQVLAIGHTPADVPPVVREAVTHCILTFTNNRSVVAELARTYLAGDVARLREVLARVRGHAVVKINARLNTVDVHSAPPAPAGGAEEGGAGGVDLRVGAPALAGASVSAQARGPVAVTGTYNDASTTNQYLRLEENLVQQQRVNALALRDMRERARVSRELELEGEAHAARLAVTRENREAYDLLHRHYLSAEDRARLAKVLALRLGDARIGPHNYRALGADREFMAIYYPDAPYRPPDAAVQAAGSYVPLLVRGDYGAAVGELAISAVAAPPAAGGLVGLAAGAVRGLRGALFGAAGEGAGGGAPPRREDTERLARRQEIRRLAVLALRREATGDEKARLIALLGGVYTRGPVTRANYRDVAQRFLRAYYPATLEGLL